MDKTPRRLPALLAIPIVFVLSSPSQALVPGPHGGKVFKSGKVAIEFTVDKSEHPHLFRLDAKGVPVALEKMNISIKALTKKKNITIRLSRTVEGLGLDKGEVEHLAGSVPMPEPDEYPVEIAVKLGKESRKFRFKFIGGFCAECGLPAFSCTCPE